MRRIAHSALLLTATLVFASAGASTPTPATHQHLAQPLLRTSSNGLAAEPVQIRVKPAKTVAPQVAKSHVSQPAAKLAAHATLASRAKLQRKHSAMHRPSPAISLPLDEVRVVAFSQPIATIYVGNPMIADVSMIDSRHAFVLGKGFGATNIVALDAAGKQVVNDPVSVFGHTGNSVILHRGTAQATLTCGHVRCEAAPTPGDDKDSYSSRMEQMGSHQDAGLKAASAH